MAHCGSTASLDLSQGVDPVGMWRGFEATMDGRWPQVVTLGKEARAYSANSDSSTGGDSTTWMA